MVAALAAARGCRSQPEDALELTLLVARKSDRHPPVATRWCSATSRKIPAATVEEAALAAFSLIALTGAGYQEAVQTLRAIAERPLGGGGNRVA